MTKISFLIITVGSIILFAANCHERSTNSTTTFDSSKNSSNNQTQFEDSSLIAKGKSLFTSNCGTCHAVFATDNYLRGIMQRISVNYFKLYVTKQDSLIKAKDEYAIKVKRAYGNLGNSHNFKFFDEQLNAIIAFLKRYSG